MIAGIGVDVVDLARFERAIAITPRLIERLFAESERGLVPRSLAGRFAAKEALIKAIGESTGARWHDIEVIVDEHGSPGFRVSGGVGALVAARGIVGLHLSISHDGGVAVATVVAEK